MALSIVDQNQPHGELVMKCFRFHLSPNIALRKRERRSGSEIHIRDRHIKEGEKRRSGYDMQSQSGIFFTIKKYNRKNQQKTIVRRQVASEYYGNEPLNCR
jgi:hypothetical protein